MSAIGNDDDDYDNAADPTPENCNMFVHRVETIKISSESDRNIMLIWLAREHPEIFDAAFSAAQDSAIEAGPSV